MCLPGTGASDPRRTPSQPHPQVKRSLRLRWRLRSGFALPQPTTQPLILIDAEALIVVVAEHYNFVGLEALPGSYTPGDTSIVIQDSTL